MSKITMAAPCLFGLEGLVAGELRAMDAQDVTAENGRVLFSGDEALLARANLNARYAERICIRMGQCRAVTFEQLFQAVRALPWERWIGKTDAFPVKGHCVGAQLSSVSACQSIIKKAVVERLRQVYRLPWFDESGPVHQIQFLNFHNEVTILLDTSGEGLHKRGYRANATEAPIKETLAAAMAYLAHVRGDSVVCDPCCGSGTLIIEAALLAMHIAPGLRRRFAAEKWAQLPAEVWAAERRRAQEQIRTDCTFRAFGSDIDPHAVQLAQENAAKAGVGKHVQIACADVADFAPEARLPRADELPDGVRRPTGVLLCNPPYGERLLDIRQAEELYRVLGARAPKGGWNMAIITPDEQFEDCFGRRADKRRKLYNGMIKCQVYLYDARSGQTGGKSGRTNDAPRSASRKER